MMSQFRGFKARRRTFTSSAEVPRKSAKIEIPKNAEH
jgi:hypothetical protein